MSAFQGLKYTVVVYRSFRERTWCQVKRGVRKSGARISGVPLYYVSFHRNYTYTVKICDPERRSKFILRDMHNVSHKFDSVRTLQSALYHKFDNQIPDGDFNVGYFEGSSHKKKWLVPADDLTAMYAKFKGKKNIPLWCDGKEMPYDEDDEEEEHSRKK